MRKLANTFLILFLISAGLHLTAELGRQYLSISPPVTLIQGLWLSSLLLAAILYAGFAFNRHLPLATLLPLQLWLTWSLIDYWPLENFIGPRYQLFAAVVQLILGLIILHLNRTLNNAGLLFTAKQFSGTAFSFKRFGLFSLGNLFVVPLLLMLCGFSLAGHLIHDRSAGFVRLKPNGLYMAERTYRRADKQLQLAGMIHLARPEYYTALTAAIPAQRTLILLEGVTDHQGLLTEQFSYARIAELLDLTPQGEATFAGRLISQKQLESAHSDLNPAVDMLPADLDLSAFNPVTIEVLNTLAKEVLNADSPLTGYAEFNRWAQTNVPPDFDKIIMADLIDKRNQHLAGFLPAALKKYDNLVIPWGALHMKGIEQIVLEKGFQPINSRERLSIDFFDLPYAEAWNKFF